MKKTSFNYQDNPSRDSKSTASKYCNDFRFFKALGISLTSGFSLALIQPLSVIAQTYPNPNGEPLFGDISLSTEFTPSPQSYSVVAGGETDITNLELGRDCTGFITASQPDFRLNYYAHQTSNLELVFDAYSSVDTTLVINGPDNRWYCNDDVDGSRNPHVAFDFPQSGQYDIWVGHFGSSSTSPAQLQIRELYSQYCVSVDSKTGWQRYSFPNSFSRISSINGGWSVDSIRYSFVGATGHTGRDADELAPYYQYKYDQRFPFGALLVSNGNENIWAGTPTNLGRYLTTVNMRINDADSALGDNDGYLNVCFSN